MEWLVILGDVCRGLLGDPAAVGLGGVIGFVVRAVLERAGVRVVVPLQFASSSSNRKRRKGSSPPSD